jgi:hypothetical protein
MASNLKSARQDIVDELKHAKEGARFYENRVAQLEQLLAQIEQVDGGHRSQGKRKAAPTTAVNAKSATKGAGNGNGKGALPVTGNEFWLNVVTGEPQTGAEIGAAAIAQLGLNSKDKTQIQKLKQRVTPGLNALVSAGKVKDSGVGRERRFQKFY